MDALEIMIRKRQRVLWAKIVKMFEVEDRLNIQVQTWIREGTVSEHAYNRMRRTRIK